jgi:hypothetical protein
MVYALVAAPWLLVLALLWALLAGKADAMADKDKRIEALSTQVAVYAAMRPTSTPTPIARKP